jgi:hypothetical protein
VTHLGRHIFSEITRLLTGRFKQGGKIAWLTGQTALTDLDGKSIAHDFEAQARTCAVV